MKKLLGIFIIVFALSSCSQEEKDFNTIEEESSNEIIQAKDFFCGPGYHLEWALTDTPIRLFKKPKPFCNKGFGFCFGLDAVFTFDCVRNTINNTPDSNAIKFNSDGNEIDVVAVENLKDKKITFYFSSDVINSSDNIPSDFDIFVVEDGVYISNNYKLTGGSYPKIVDGAYFKYDVPYIYEN
ncbi:hypothetical protein [uncultured Winogradskyella sp.]|uniref:hypothetical protein n=1 Tax=uncultured Winogradskyella sp. TaxID=395353 RepID=UPI002612256C|nr:hypothetical protein [uncultured Winogradskyella sp.]